MAVKSLCYCHLIDRWAISCLSLAWALQSLRISSELIIYYGFWIEKWSRYLEIVGWSWLGRKGGMYVAGLRQTGCWRVWRITYGAWARVCWCLRLCICPDRRPLAVSFLCLTPLRQGLFPEHGAHIVHPGWQPGSPSGGSASFHVSLWWPLYIGSYPAFYVGWVLSSALQACTGSTLTAELFL